MSFAARFWCGFTLLPAGWRLLREQRALWTWIAIPWLINLSVLIAGWIFGLGAVQTLTAWAVSQLVVGGWLFGVLYYPAVVIFGFMFLILWLIAVLGVATVVASPFNAVLAERALTRQGVATATTGSLSAWLRLFLKMILVAGLKGVIFILAGVTLFVLSFVPGLNLVAAYASMCLFAVDVFDYSFEALGWGFRRRLSEVGRTKPEMMGLGGSLLLTSLLPGLTVLCLPVSVLGATTQVARQLGKK